MSTREAKKELRRQKQIPKPRQYAYYLNNKEYPVSVVYTQTSITFNTVLPVSGEKVQCHFEQGISTIQKKVRLLDAVPVVTMQKGSNLKLARNKNGKPITVQIAVPALILTISFDDGKEVVTRAVCKAPDVWNTQIGIKYAIRHLYDQHRKEILPYFKGEEDYQILLKVCMTRPPKPGQIKWRERKRKEKK